MNRLFSHHILSFITLSGGVQPTINCDDISKKRYVVSKQKLSPNPVVKGNRVTWDYTEITTDTIDSIIKTEVGGTTPFKFKFLR